MSAATGPAAGDEIAAALELLDNAAMEARLHNDPLQLPFRALAAHLRAWRAAQSETQTSLVKALEQARQPIRDADMRRALAQAISAQAPALITAFNRRTDAIHALLYVGVLVAGFGLGAWWMAGRDAARLAELENTLVAAHSGWPVMNAQDAALWQHIIAINPPARELLKSCQPIPSQPRGGIACSLPIWTTPPG